MRSGVRLPPGGLSLPSGRGPAARSSGCLAPWTVSSGWTRTSHGFPGTFRSTFSRLLHIVTWMSPQSASLAEPGLGECGILGGSIELPQRELGKPG